ncbi:MAG: hypothetical protein AB1505_07520 [Candidatus Latescibacterota bacterium]
MGLLHRPLIVQIDALEQLLEGEQRDSALKTRRLITAFEVCHHNSLRWAERIARAIADGAIPAPSGRQRGEHPVTVAHLSLRELLAGIADGATNSGPGGEVPAIDAARLAHRLGALSDRQRWLVGLVLDNLEHHLHDANLIPVMRTTDNRMFPGGALNVASEDEARAYFRDSFGHYLSYRDVTVHLVDDLHPTEKRGRMPLLLVVQFANPCSANYFPYVSALLQMVCGADEIPSFPFPFCGHCSATQPRELRKYALECESLLGRNKAGGLREERLSGQRDHGERARRWLVASFGKTLRLQLGE